MKVLMHLLPDGLDTRHAVVVEGAQGVGEQPDGLKEIVDQHRHEDVQFEITLAGSDTDSGVVSHHLDRHHGDGFALGGIHLARHDGAPGLVLRDADLAEAAAGTAGKPAHVIGDLHHIRRQRLQGAVSCGQLRFGSQGVVFVAGGAEGAARQFSDRLCCLRVEVLRRVQPRADSSPAQSKIGEGSEGRFDHLPVILQGGAPAADLLGEEDGHRVLQVRAAGLHDTAVLILQRPEGAADEVDGGQQAISDLQDRRDMHGGGESVVGTLGHVDMVVGVKKLFPCQLVSAVGNDLVHIHIGLGAASRLPYRQGEVAGKLSFPDLLRDSGDQLCALLVQA